MKPTLFECVIYDPLYVPRFVAENPSFQSTVQYMDAHQCAHLMARLKWGPGSCIIDAIGGLMVDCYEFTDANLSFENSEANFDKGLPSLLQ